MARNSDRMDRAAAGGATYLLKGEAGTSFPPGRTALLVIDPVNDFLSGLCHVHVRRVGWATPTPRRPPVPKCSNPYRGHRVPRDVIAHAVRLHLRFALRSRDGAERVAERGIQGSYETVRRWVTKSGARDAEAPRTREVRLGPQVALG